MEFEPVTGFQRLSIWADVWLVSFFMGLYRPWGKYFLKRFMIDQLERGNSVSLRTIDGDEVTYFPDGSITFNTVIVTDAELEEKLKKSGQKW